MYAGINVIKYGLIALVMAGLFGLGFFNGSDHVQNKWNAEKLLVAESEKRAVFERLKANERQVEQDAINNAKIKGTYEKEIASVKRDLAASKLRLGPSFGGVTKPTEAPTASGDHAADTGGGLVPESVAKHIRELIDETERVAAVARACQRFISETTGK